MMDTNLKFSLITTIIALGVIVAFSLTAILHLCFAEGGAPLPPHIPLLLSILQKSFVISFTFVFL